MQKPRPLVASALALFLSLAACSSSRADHGPTVKALASKLPEGSVIYGVVPPLFGDHAFRGVTAKLDQIKSLGVDALWLSPVNETDDSGKISYSITNYYKLRSDFGTEAEFRTLVSEAHKRGLKVMMDFVPNHTSNKHPQFLEAERQGPGSRYYDFYARDEDGKPTYYFNWSNLMNLNYANEEVRDEMKNAFRYWITEFGIDGYRVDAAWGVEEREPGFWKELIAELRQTNPDLVMLAEAGARDSVYVASGFDLAYDWSSELGKWAWESAFTNLEKTGDGLRSALMKNSDPSRVFRFINNNDTGERFIARHGAAVAKVGAVLTQTVPGVPVVYSGDEVGAEYSPYDDPAPLTWQDPHALMPFYKALIAIRKSHEALRSGAMKMLSAPSSVLAFERTTALERIVVILNFGSRAQNLKLAGDWVDVLSGETYRGTIGATSSVILTQTR